MTMWFPLTGDERLGRCASEGCGGQPIYRFESDGVGSNYCSGCRAAIDKVRDDVVECVLNSVGEQPSETPK